MFKWYKSVVLENYANFNGRARRSEFWYFTLMHLIIIIAAAIIDTALNLKIGSSDSGIIRSLYSLLIFIPSLAVSVRRLHDIGKSGWWLLAFYMVFIVSGAGFSFLWIGSGINSLDGVFKILFYVFPLILLGTIIWMLILSCTSGNQGANKYGLDPKIEGDEINEIGTA